jgi:hypothetical protein
MEVEDILRDRRTGCMFFEFEEALLLFFRCRLDTSPFELKMVQRKLDECLYLDKKVGELLEYRYLQRLVAKW